MKKLFVFYVLLFCLQTVDAQQMGLYSFYRNNWQLLNPALPNANFFLRNQLKYFTLNASYRQQWIGTKGVPSNYNISFENTLDPDMRNSTVKWGMNLYGERANAWMTHGLQFNYAYGIRLDRRKQFLFIGMNTGISEQRIDLSNANFLHQTNDVILDEWRNTPNRYYADINIGLAYTYWNYFYAAISVPQALTLGIIKTPSLFDTKRPRYINALVGGTFENITTSAWLRYTPNIEYASLFEGNPLSMTINGQYRLKEKMWFGLGLSTAKWTHFEVGVMNIGRNKSANEDYSFNVGLAYDLPYSISGWRLGQTIEINFSLNWGN
jgi:type IX secretion system PorP/SprF family membrane protein